jgi:hypothetical protein
MNSYTYEPLDLAVREIRLIEIQPSAQFSAQVNPESSRQGWKMHQNTTLYPIAGETKRIRSVSDLMETCFQWESISISLSEGSDIRAGQLFFGWMLSVSTKRTLKSEVTKSL